MKKVLLFLFVIILVAVGTMGGYMYGKKSSTPSVEQRIVSFDGYDPFYPGTYVGGEDLEPGTYDIVITGLTRMGQVLHYSSREEYNKQGKYDLNNLSANSSGFHFNIREGEVVCFHFSEVGEMGIKKTN